MVSFFLNYSESLKFYNKRKNGKVIFLISAYLVPEITHLAPRENESGKIYHCVTPGWSGILGSENMSQ